MKIVLGSAGSKKPYGLTGLVSFEDGKEGLPASIKKVLGAKKFLGKEGQSLLLTVSGHLYFVMGLGKRDKFTLQKVRLTAAKLLSQAKSLQEKIVSLSLEGFGRTFSAAEIAGASVEGLRLSSYQFDKYKSKKSPGFECESFTLLSSDSTASKAVYKKIAETEIIMSAITFTRDLANEPSNVMTPVRLAEEAKKMALKNNLDCKVLGLAEITRLKMGGILGVSRGSALEPRFIILQNRVKAADAKDPIVLVGKGVTFDTGGISIKPANDMDKMKFDMCGAAAVMGAMKAIGNLKLNVKVIGITPVVENMPGGNAQKPGDIVTFYNGKTAEVLNTDAEGRLILADALAYAKNFKPKVLVNIATLTGACSATFADLATGIMGTDASLVERIRDIGERTGERLWELPLWEEYGTLIKATYADIQNISKRYAGTITAGMFLKEFADHTSSWAHLDIAGTAWNEGGPKALSPIGATGVGVRWFVELAKSYSR